MKRLIVSATVVLLVSAGFLAGSWVTWRTTSFGRRLPAQRKVLRWIDPMHPTYQSDKPGIAPDCGMALEPVYEADAASASTAPVSGPTILVTDNQRQAIGVRLGVVEAGAVRTTVRTVGRVTVDDNNVYRVVATSDGIVRDRQPVNVGSFVTRDQRLLTFYSADFLGAEQAYFYALATLERVAGSPAEPARQLLATNAQLRAAVDGLRTLGMSDTQLVAIGRTRQPTRDIELRSPVTGFVLSRSVFPEQRLEKNAELYRIADLSRVWVIAEFAESDAAFVRPGAPVRLTLPYAGAPPLAAAIDDALPQIDPVSRTLKARISVDNPAALIRPEMFVDVDLAVDMPAVLTVPSEAVLDSGARKVVFVDRGGGRFEARRVETGRRAGERVEILRGLAAGESIAVSGNFLLDAETRLKLTSAGIADPDIDPVCGMDLDASRSRREGRTSVYGGSSFYFCSETCKRKFDASPTSFAGGRAPRQPAPAIVPARQAGGVRVASSVVSTDDLLERIRPAGGDHEANARRASEGSVFVTDPACGAEVDTTAPGVPRLVYRGTAYYFFSTDCKKAFERDPQAFVEPAAQAAPGESDSQAETPPATDAGGSAGTASPAGQAPGVTAAVSRYRRPMKTNAPIVVPRPVQATPGTAGTSAPPAKEKQDGTPIKLPAGQGS
jgi:membrane fusion protein, copper/silver efflux system